MEGKGLHLGHEKTEKQGTASGERTREGSEGGACSRTCIPQSGIPPLLHCIHIYAASLGDNSAIMRRARARPSRRAVFVPLRFALLLFLSVRISPLARLSLPHFIIPVRVYVRLIGDTKRTSGGICKLYQSASL